MQILWNYNHDIENIGSRVDLIKGSTPDVVGLERNGKPPH